MDSSRFASLDRSLRRLKVWNIVLTAVLLLSLAANAAWVQAAADPPVRVYTATLDDSGGGGSSINTAQPIDPTATRESPQTLASVITSHLSRDHKHICLVTASALATKPVSPSNAFVNVALRWSRRNTVIVANERVVELKETPDDDPRSIEVSTTYAFKHVRRNQGIHFVAWGDDIVVTKASMTVVCLRHPL
jgi:hypothetical protein